jgi:hypothetical protein
MTPGDMLPVSKLGPRPPVLLAVWVASKRWNVRNWVHLMTCVIAAAHLRTSSLVRTLKQTDKTRRSKVLPINPKRGPLPKTVLCLFAKTTFLTLIIAPNWVYVNIHYMPVRVVHSTSVTPTGCGRSPGVESSKRTPSDRRVGDDFVAHQRPGEIVPEWIT